MKVRLPEERLKDIVKELIFGIYPDFNKEGTYRLSQSNFSFYMDKNTDKKYAVYWHFEKALQLDNRLFMRLENFIGGELMTYVIDWFNEEFNEDAESVSF